MKVGILTGPTATGKTGYALQKASELGNIEIINADSLLVYRGMDIGTAKPTAHELNQVQHHLIDILDPDQSFTAGEFFRAAKSAIQEIHSRGKRALIVGGTGFYLKSLLYGLWSAPPGDPQLRERLKNLGNAELFRQLKEVDSASAERIGPSDPYRLVRALELHHLTGKTPTELQAEVPKEPDPQFQLWIIDRDNSELFTRIQTRTKEMLTQGIVNEYQTLSSRFPESRALLAVGYAQVKSYLIDEKPSGRKVKPGLEGLSEEIQLATRQLVKRQRTWFRGQCPHSEWFELDKERAKLEEAFNSVYK